MARPIIAQSSIFLAVPNFPGSPLEYIIMIPAITMMITAIGITMIRSQSITILIKSLKFSASKGLENSREVVLLEVFVCVFLASTGNFEAGAVRVVWSNKRVDQV